MIIDTSKGFTKILADEGKKITDKKRTFFSDFICVAKNGNIEDYEEVGREIWKHFIEDKSTDFDILCEKIEEMQSSILQLEEISLQADFKLLNIGLYLETEKNKNIILNTMTNSNVMTDYEICALLKKKIRRKGYGCKEEMKLMLDKYYLANRISVNQYDELIELLQLS